MEFSNKGHQKMNQLKKKNQLNLNAIAGIEDLSDEMAATQCGGRKFVKVWTDFLGKGKGAWQRDVDKNRIYNMTGTSFNDKVSSLEISSEAPDGLKVTLYEDTNGRGKSWTLDGKGIGYDFRLVGPTFGGGSSQVTGRKAISATDDRKFYETNVPNDKISSIKYTW